MTQKDLPFSFECHEALGAELCEMYSLLGVMGALYIQHYRRSDISDIARQVQVLINVLTDELDKQFQEDYPEKYHQEVYFH